MKVGSARLPDVALGDPSPWRHVQARPRPVPRVERRRRRHPLDGAGPPHNHPHLPHVRHTHAQQSALGVRPSGHDRRLRRDAELSACLHRQRAHDAPRRAQRRDSALRQAHHPQQVFARSASCYVQQAAVARGGALHNGAARQPEQKPVGQGHNRADSGELSRVVLPHPGQLERSEQIAGQVARGPVDALAEGLVHVHVVPDGACVQVRAGVQIAAIRVQRHHPLPLPRYPDSRDLARRDIRRPEGLPAGAAHRMPRPTERERAGARAHAAQRTVLQRGHRRGAHRAVQRADRRVDAGRAHVKREDVSFGGHLPPRPLPDPGRRHDALPIGICSNTNQSVSYFISEDEGPSPTPKPPLQRTYVMSLIHESADAGRRALITAPVPRHPPRAVRSAARSGTVPAP